MTTARQLSLFRSRKQRGTMPPAPTEFASQACVVDLIRRRHAPRWRSAPMPTTPHRQARSPNQEEIFMSARLKDDAATSSAWP
jgi:hypothetical protein